MLIELSDLIRNTYIVEGIVGRENVALVCSASDKRFEFKILKGIELGFPELIIVILKYQKEL
jgi:hypothetical protein